MWFCCPYCAEAWVSDGRRKEAICPKCRVVWRIRRGGEGHLDPTGKTAPMLDDSTFTLKGAP